MSLIINNNSMANTAARNLNTAYQQLSESTEKLSSGMRINDASDDAAGLAVREMMRAEVTTLNQGVRNANDAISMIQTADGAMAVIDEKLIRMNELAEQAATGTYTDEQREIIDQEYQTMADEITRISDSTDFNGQKLLDGSLDSTTENGEAMTIHFGTGNDAAEDKYDIEIQDVSAEALGIGADSQDYVTNDDGTLSTADGKAIYQNADGDLYVESEVGAGPLDAADEQVRNIGDSVVATDATEEQEAKDLVSAANLTFTEAGGFGIGTPVANTNDITVDGTTGVISDTDGNTIYSKTDEDGNVTYTTDNSDGTGTELTLDALKTDMYELSDDGSVTMNGDTVYVDAGGDLTLAADDGGGNAHDAASLDVTTNITEDELQAKLGATEEYAGSSIATQEGAQAALDAIGEAITLKDTNRANLGAYENRLEATISNLEIQSENLAAAESRISDVDVATEMTEYTLRQTISQAATSMLAQANTQPQTALTLIG